VTNQAYRVSPWATHERLDDEAIIINLETGLYFALNGTGADAWTLLTQSGQPASVGLALARRYDVDPGAVRFDLDRLLKLLVDEGLLVAGDEDGQRPADEVDLPPLPEAAQYAAPELESFDDLDSLLLLDPIHEVDDAGWPVMRGPE
jgi:hypothetical protein